MARPGSGPVEFGLRHHSPQDDSFCLWLGFVFQILACESFTYLDVTCRRICVVKSTSMVGICAAEWLAVQIGWLGLGRGMDHTLYTCINCTVDNLLTVTLYSTRGGC